MIKKMIKNLIFTVESLGLDYSVVYKKNPSRVWVFPIQARHALKWRQVELH